MEVTKVVFKSYGDARYMKSLATFDIILDDKLRLTSVRLYQKKKGDFYMVFPSRQDIYQEIGELNEGKEIAYPDSEKSGKKKKYEEFFFPMDYAFYGEVLNTVVKGYKVFVKKKLKVGETYNYIPR